MSDWQKLREAAMSATPGEWLHARGSTSVYVQTTQLGGDGVLYGSICWVPEDGDDQLSDLAHTQATFIALANPTTILALLDQLAAVTAERDVLRAESLEWRRIARKVVLERMSKIMHARESAAMIELQKMVGRNCDAIDGVGQ